MLGVGHPGTGRATHQQDHGVFDAYTEEVMRAGWAGIVTGLPGADGRGRIIGEFRRVAAYGVDRLVTAERAGAPGWTRWRRPRT